MNKHVTPAAATDETADMVRQAREAFYAKHPDRAAKPSKPVDTAKPARERARELLPDLDAHFREQFPGHGSVFDPEPSVEEIIYRRAYDLVVQWEMADSRDRWKHTGEPPPMVNVVPFPKERAYQTPQSTIDAFWFVVRNYDDASIEAWLDERPRDRLFLINLLDVKNAG